MCSPIQKNQQTITTPRTNDLKNKPELIKLMNECRYTLNRQIRICGKGSQTHTGDFIKFIIIELYKGYLNIMGEKQYSSDPKHRQAFQTDWENILSSYTTELYTNIERLSALKNDIQSFADSFCNLPKEMEEITHLLSDDPFRGTAYAKLPIERRQALCTHLLIDQDVQAELLKFYGYSKDYEHKGMLLLFNGGNNYCQGVLEAMSVAFSNLIQETTSDTLLRIHQACSSDACQSNGKPIPQGLYGRSVNFGVWKRDMTEAGREDMKHYLQEIYQLGSEGLIFDHTNYLILPDENQRVIKQYVKENGALCVHFYEGEENGEENGDDMIISLPFSTVVERRYFPYAIRAHRDMCQVNRESVTTQSLEKVLNTLFEMYHTEMAAVAQIERNGLTDPVKRAELRLLCIAKLSKRIQTLHPFEDANGRSATLLAYREMLKHGLPLMTLKHPNGINGYAPKEIVREWLGSVNWCPYPLTPAH